jgi:undecaprenyl diphosphate synthase
MYKPNDFHPAIGPHPLHVGLIPDGGRRWAANNACSLAEAYNQTCQKLERLFETLWQLNVDELSIYIASKENFRRPENEIKAFVEITKKALGTHIAQLAVKHQVRVCVAGSKSILPDELIEAVNTLENATQNHADGTLNLCIGYHPADEISHALKTAPKPEAFYNYLWVKKPLDLIIRSGGANVLSNFLPLQSGYARLYFFNDFFNDLKNETIQQTIENYCNEVLKYGT